MSTARPEPFEVGFAADVLDDLRARLANARWAEPVGDDDWRYGVPTGWLRDMCAWWRDEWDAAGETRAMNAYDHYRVELDGVPIHYLHAKASRPDAPPLLLSHGWPWTFWDFKDVIGPLSRPEDFGGDPSQAFDVYVPSLPGFGFSTPLRTAGVDVPSIARLWAKLMTEVLGFERFAAHGGDWGGVVTAELAHAHAEALIGAHMSLPFVPGVGPAELTSDAYAEDERWMLARMAEAAPTIESHVSVHLRDPQTLAHAMTDSPVGMAAWLWERRRAWSDCDGEVERVFSRQHLCTTAALYWCTGAFGSSLRIYHEHMGKPWVASHDRAPILEAPCAYAVFPKDVIHVPRAVIEKNTDLRQYTVLPSGGHFGAAEQPERLVDDLRRFFHETLAV